MAKLIVLIATVAIVLGAVRSQGGPTANLLENAALRNHLQTWAATKPCPEITNDGVKSAIEEIRDYGYLVYLLNTESTTKDKAMNKYTGNEVADEAMVESTKTPSTPVEKSGDKQDWGNPNSKIVYSWTRAFAITVGEATTVYHWEFHLNLQGRTISSRADYVSGLKAIACTETLDWVTRHFPK